MGSPGTELLKSHSPGFFQTRGTDCFIDVAHFHDLVSQHRVAGLVVCMLAVTSYSYKGDKRKEPSEILITANVLEVDRWRSQWGHIHWHPQWRQNPRVVGIMLLLQNECTGHHSGNSFSSSLLPRLHPHIYKHPPLTLSLSFSLILEGWSPPNQSHPSRNSDCALSKVPEGPFSIITPLLY